ncbi:hypothetical protein RYA95_27390 [Pseudomonas syringae pv. actinidiae]|nr:hypothetical protein [Pseudomonas syringae pv. actinidiae]MDU8556847.1 hypothetical protein [Pseudomonas syringae pv. actinidiae]MDU8588355.1 hypothetical protein [Pseudomonas syringae pv. actinidiae]MDU8599200.1 hypothetical protein [Pseudomonas syringae pv. actinidiae]MDU8616735.1 hypothetical protein [Pseudomonas syringae pv. actinidiae]
MRQELGRHIKLFISPLWVLPEFPSADLTFTLRAPRYWIARYLGISKNTVTGIVRRHRETA